MKIYYLNDDNLQDIKVEFKILYDITIKNLEDKLISFKKDKTEKEKNGKEEQILIYELYHTIDILKDIKFEKYFLKLEMEILEKIRYVSVSKHTIKCITRAVFDLIFKYCIDFEYKIPSSCCDNIRFKKLQFEILRDLRWKIIT